MTTAPREWIGARVAFPGYVLEGAPYRPDLIVWIELPEGLVVGGDVVDPARPVSSADALRIAMTAPKVGAPRRPDRVRVADPDLAAELRAAELGVDVVVAPTPEIDEALASMTEALTIDDEDRSYLEDGAISPETVAELFSTAQRLWAVAPWRVAGDEQVLRVDVPALGVEGWCLSIIGALGESIGFLLFESLAGFEGFLRAAEHPERGRLDLGSSILSLTFERGADLPASMRREVARHAWKVAAPDAYPRVDYRDRDGLDRPLQERDLRIVTAIAASLTAFFVKHGAILASDKFEPICESWYDQDDLEVRFTAPYEAYELFTIAPVSPRAGDGPRVGRNAPCPCGSGRKYKKCCLAKDDAGLDPLVETKRTDTSRLHELDRRLVFEMCDYAERRFGRRWRRFARDFADPECVPSLAIPWSVYGFHVEGQPVVRWLSRQPDRRLAPEERAWLASQERAWLSVWEVTEVDPGVGVTVMDLLGGETRRVREASGSETLVVRDAVLARVVEHRGLAVFCGMYPCPLPPFEAADVVKRVRTRLRCKGDVPIARLREEDVGRQLIRGWERAARDLERRIRTPPELVNTDGDALLITTDHFTFDPERCPEILASLTAMDDVTPPNDGRTDDGVCFTFLRTGNAMHASWENTVVGTASLEADHLRLETNSVRRADELRGRVASACGSLLRHDRREQVDPLVEMAENRERPAEPPAPDPPQASAMLRAYKARHYADWIDQALPALRGKTPRAAARTPTGRARVELLLKAMEHDEARLPATERYDFSSIRRALGLALS